MLCHLFRTLDNDISEDSVQVIDSGCDECMNRGFSSRERVMSIQPTLLNGCNLQHWHPADLCP